MAELPKDESLVSSAFFFTVLCQEQVMKWILQKMPIRGLQRGILESLWRLLYLHFNNSNPEKQRQKAIAFTYAIDLRKSNATLNLHRMLIN
jgi:hypothetical protein